MDRSRYTWEEELAPALTDHIGAALGDIVGMIRLEAPGVEADGDVIGEHVVAGEIEVDQARDLVAEEEDVVGEEVGVNNPLGQIARPFAVEMLELLLDDA